ncbi:MAG: hypothetical protein AAF933_09235 [Pseudomonadota bacterium]
MTVLTARLRVAAEHREQMVCLSFRGWYEGLLGMAEGALDPKAAHELAGVEVLMAPGTVIR